MRTRKPPAADATQTVDAPSPLYRRRGIDIFLQPGEVHFGNRDTTIRTLLGSCVSLVLWHPELLIGGMCHYMLPRAEGRQGEDRPLDGRYADEAIELLRREIDTIGVPHREFQAKVFGGGDMFSHLGKFRGTPVGLRNVEAARRLVRDHGFTCTAEHLGGVGHRKLIFEVWSGRVWMRRQEGSAPEQALVVPSSATQATG